MKSFGFFLTVCCIGLAACGGGSQSPDQSDTTVAIPRPKAYPRLTIYGPEYVNAGLPAGFRTNRAADVDTVDARGQWYDVCYPAYGATMHLTFRPVDSSTRDAIVDNRLQRMALNIGDNFAEQTEVESHSGFTTIILTTTGPTLTPLQFLSVGGQWVINGALQFDASEVVADSVMPIIEAVKADVVHAALNLQ